MSEWKKKKSVPEKERGRERTELASVLLFLSEAPLFGTVAEDDDDDVGEKSTMRHRCNNGVKF